MVRQNPPRQASSSPLMMEDGGSSSDSNSASDHPLGDSKPIPFLRRLRDMLIENEDSISFVPGRRARTGENISLGRIVVHDRIRVEATVLPKYFNHSSFASLRRQLNYFRFVRLGKGRQLESTYVNDCVVDLDDVLTLKRRSSTSTTVMEERRARTKANRRVSEISETGIHEKGPILFNEISTSPERKKSYRKENIPLRADGHTSGVVMAVESREGGFSNRSSYNDHEELLAGCQALLGLSGKQWNPHSVS